ncbi:MAG: hypothetical protein FWD49_07600 [Firmicutes bacterium]|nr:hypothetical protein [Bacillota bacterium]
MKNKIIKIITIVCLAVIIAVGLMACDLDSLHASKDTNEGNGGNDAEIPTLCSECGQEDSCDCPELFTVTFSWGWGVIFTQTVEPDSFVTAPTRAEFPTAVQGSNLRMAPHFILTGWRIAPSSEVVDVNEYAITEDVEFIAVGKYSPVMEHRVKIRSLSVSKEVVFDIKANNAVIVSYPFGGIAPYSIQHVSFNGSALTVNFTINGNQQTLRYTWMERQGIWQKNTSSTYSLIIDPCW